MLQVNFKPTSALLGLFLLWPVVAVFIFLISYSDKCGHFVRRKKKKKVEREREKRQFVKEKEKEHEGTLQRERDIIHRFISDNKSRLVSFFSLSQCIDILPANQLDLL